jgi:choline dehydrogenase-like flavoprotein
LTGDDDWSPENVLPYFKKSEDDFRGESKYHGTGGEFAVSDVRYQNPLSKTFLSACGENGFSSNDDFNNWSRSQEGYGRYQVAERDGSRCSAASGFLAPIMKRKNLNIVTKATVNRVTFEGDEATGVDVIINGQSHHVGLSTGGEVLLTGGAISSPQILMLSGVGPEKHLTEHGINTVRDLPGVGQNLQDHPASVVSYACSKGNEGISVTSVIRIPGTTLNNPKVVLDWLLNKSGPLTSTGCDHGGFFKTKNSLESPDLQLRFLAAKAITADGMGTFTKVYHSHK